MSGVKTHTPMTEKDVAKKLKTLKTTKKSIQRMAGELRNVRSPELRSAMLDFILFDYSGLDLSHRLSIFLNADPGNINLVDHALIDRLTAIKKGEEWKTRDTPPFGRVRDRVLTLLSLAGNSANEIRGSLPEEYMDRVMREVIDVFREYFVLPTGMGTQIRGMLNQALQVLRSKEKVLRSREKRDEYLRLIADAVLGAFEKQDWKNIEPALLAKQEVQAPESSIMGGEWDDINTRDLVNKLFLLVAETGREENWERLMDTLTKSGNPALLFATLMSAHSEGFSDEQATRIIRAALSLPEEKVKSCAEYLYPELYFKACLAAPRLREECLERTIQYAAGSNTVRGLGLVIEYLLSQHEEYRQYELVRDRYGAPPHSSLSDPEQELADLEKALSAVIAVSCATRDMTSREWEINALSDGRRKEYGGSRSTFAYQATPSRALLNTGIKFADYICKRGETQDSYPGKGSERSARAALLCAYNSMEKIFNVLLDSMERKENSYGRGFFSADNKISAFVDAFFGVRIAYAAEKLLPEAGGDKFFFFTEAGENKFYDRIKFLADPNICGNAITEMANSIWRRQRQLASSGKNDPGESERLSQKIERTRRQAEGVIAVMAEELKGDSSSSLDMGVELTAIKEFAPFFARELSKLDTSCARETLSKILKGGGLGNSGAAQLLFSGELSGGGLEFLKEDNSKNLHNMITAILGAGGGDALPWWFSEEKFIRGCVEFTDRPRNFSIPDIVSRSAFLSIPVAFLKNNPANTWATELVAEFLSLCGRRVIQSARESAAENEGVRLYQYQSHLLAQQVQSLEELEALMGGRLAELEREAPFTEVEAGNSGEESGVGGISF